MDRDQFEERAAIMEYEGGLSRFRAETMAAKEQGVERWEIIGDVAGRIVKAARNNRETMEKRAGSNNVPKLQRGAKEESRPLPQRHGGE